MIKNKQSHGYLLAIGSYIIWGLSPIYWKALPEIPPFSLLIYRVFWSLIILAIYMLINKKQRLTIEALQKNWKPLLPAGLLLGVNWFTYIFAINNGFLQDASLGYYMNPLVSIFLGMTIFKEKLVPFEKIALILALGGVGLLSFQIGRFPWISFILAFSFGFYGLLKKQSNLGAIQALSFEMSLVFPLIGGWFLFGAGGFEILKNVRIFQSPGLILLISASGLITVVPLLLFALGAKRINLSAIGFLQFISPTLLLFLSVFIYKEPFSPAKLPGFIMVWTALLLYLLTGSLKKSAGGEKSPSVLEEK